MTNKKIDNVKSQCEIPNNIKTAMNYIRISKINVFEKDVHKLQNNKKTMFFSINAYVYLICSKTEWHRTQNLEDLNFFLLSSQIFN